MVIHLKQLQEKYLGRRNEIRLESYKDEEKLELVKKSNLETYGNEFGPTADSLYEKYGSWQTVIEKACSTNAGMDACLGLYDEYYYTYGINENNSTYEYIVNSDNEKNDDSISFTAIEGEIYSFSIIDRLATTDEQIQAIVDLFNSPEFTFEILKEQLDKLIAYGKNAAGENGTLLKLYEMYLYNNGNEIHEVNGGFKLKLKMTDDMKDYDSYKLFYIADDGTTEKAIELTRNGEYLNGTLPHLSIYALVGSKTETETTTKTDTTNDTNITITTETTTNDSNTTTEDTNVTTETSTSNNPKTGDNIEIWISLMAISILGIAGLVKFIKKNK